jgi:hypothetical protein
MACTWTLHTYSFDGGGVLMGNDLDILEGDYAKVIS